MKLKALQGGVMVLGLTGVVAVLGGGAAVAAFQAEAPPQKTAPAESRLAGQRTPVISALSELSGLSRRQIVAQLLDGATLAQIAEANGASGDLLIAEVLGNARERLETAVANGYISQERMDEVIGKLQELLPKLVYGEVDWRPGHPLRRLAVLDEVADVIGITIDDLREQLGAGQSMA